MRLITPLCRCALTVALCLVVGLTAQSGTSTGTNTIQMNIESTRHGNISKISLTSVGSATAAQSNNSAAGKTGAIKVNKEVDASSPHLQTLMSTGDALKEVVIEFHRLSQGKSQVYRTMKLFNARITAIQKKNPTGSSTSSKAMEMISLTYERIEQTNGSTGKTAIDSWSQK